MLEEGRVDIIASDAHNLTSRPPCLSGAASLIADAFGEEEMWQMTVERPALILQNQPLEPVGLSPRASVKVESAAAWLEIAAPALATAFTLGKSRVFQSIASRLLALLGLCLWLAACNSATLPAGNSLAVRRPGRRKR